MQRKAIATLPSFLDITQLNKLLKYAQNNVPDPLDDLVYKGKPADDSLLHGYLPNDDLEDALAEQEDDEELAILSVEYGKPKVV